MLLVGIFIFASFILAQEQIKTTIKEITYEKKFDLEENMKYLKSDDKRMKISAIKIMGATKEKKYLKEVEPFLNDKDLDIVKAAIEAYGFSKDDAAVLKLRPMANTTNKEIRYLVVKSLFNIGGKRSEDFIIEMLDDAGDPKMRELAVGMLSTLKCKAAWNRLTRSMCCDPAKAVQRAAAKALAEIRAPLSIGDLKLNLKNPDSTVAFYAAIALARMKEKAGMDILIGKLTYEDPEIRELALDALMSIEDRNIIKPLNKMYFGEKNKGLASKAEIFLKKLEEKYK